VETSGIAPALSAYKPPDNLGFSQRGPVMQFLLVGQIKPSLLVDGPPADLQELVAQEQVLAMEYHAAGFIRQAWSMVEAPGAVAIYEAADRAELDRLLSAFPLFKADYVDAKIIEIAGYDGIAA
jgi:muconolactone delta-isomerase